MALFQAFDIRGDAVRKCLITDRLRCQFHILGIRIHVVPVQTVRII